MAKKKESTQKQATAKPVKKPKPGKSGTATTQDAEVPTGGTRPGGGNH